MPSNEYLLLALRYNKIHELLTLTTQIMVDYDAESVTYNLLSQACKLYATESLELKRQMEIELNK
jgi:hypothetical protein